MAPAASNSANSALEARLEARLESVLEDIGQGNERHLSVDNAHANISQLTIRWKIVSMLSKVHLRILPSV